MDFGAEPDAAAVLRKINGCTVADRKQLKSFQQLKEDGSTACGGWTYCGVTTYWLTELHCGGISSRVTPHTAELQPEAFVEISRARWRETRADADHQRLERANAAISVIVGRQFPLGGVQWQSIEAARQDLEALAR